MSVIEYKLQYYDFKNQEWETFKNVVVDTISEELVKDHLLELMDKFSRVEQNQGNLYKIRVIRTVTDVETAMIASVNSGE